MARSKRKVFAILLAIFIAVPLLVPENAMIPVVGARRSDWNQDSFWYSPWGASGVHKGIDIFAPAAQAVIAPVSGFVIYRGEMGIGGNVVLLMGPKWRIHYFAHLKRSNVRAFGFYKKGTELGEVGTTGNAFGKPPHLHYSVVSIVPLPWRVTKQAQGWKRMFFLDPGKIVAP